MSEELFELPEGWAYTTVQESIEIIDYRGRTPPFSEDGIPHLRSSNIKDGKVVWEGLKYVSEETYQTFMTRGLPQNGDVLFTTEAPLGEAALAPEQKFSLAQRMMLLRPNKNLLESKFLLYQIKNEEFQRKLKITGTGSTVTGVSSRNFQPLEIVIAPLNEQKRIVAKIEELNDRHQRAKQALEAIPELCDRFRQSVLAAAFRGDLTADWREENPDVEPASVLLERIENDLLASKVSNKKFNDASLETQYFQNLPESWKLVQIRDICKNSFYGPRFGKNEYVTDGIPTIRTTDMTESGEIVLKDPPRVQVTQDRLNDFKLVKDDLLITRTGSIGIMAIFREDYIAIPSAYLIRFRFSQLTLIDYIFYYLKSPVGQNLLGLNSTAVTQPNINAEVIKSLPFPLASLAEQKEIVQRIKTLFKAITQVKQQYQCSEEQLDRLNQSILAKAFRGELVEQDPDDEPASVLLDQIRAEREKLQGNKKSGSARGKRKKATDSQLDLPGVN